MGNDDGKTDLKLYIRLPTKIIESEQIYQLHPKITKVNLPRQKSRHWCIIEFENPESLESAKLDLAKVRLNGKKLYIAPVTKRDKEAKPISNKKAAKETFISTELMLNLFKNEEN